MGFSQIFKLAIVAVLISSPFNYSLAQTTPPDSSCDTSSLEAKIDALNSQTNAISAKVDTVDSSVRRESNQTRSSIIDTLLAFPIFFTEKIFTYFVLGIIDLDSDTGIFSVYRALYVARPDLSALESKMNELANMLLSVYILILVLFSIQLLYSGPLNRAELKENFLRLIIGAVLLKESYYIYNILLDLTTGLSRFFVEYINFELFTLNLKAFLLSLDIIVIFTIVFVILGVVLGALVYIAMFFGALIFPLILLSLSLPFERARALGESLLSGIIGILLAPAISASILAVIPIALQSNTSFLMNRAILLAGIILAIIIPFFVIISLILKPVVKVAAFTKIAKMVVK